MTEEEKYRSPSDTLTIGEAPHVLRRTGQYWPLGI